MALKQPRTILETDISLTCDTVKERGYFLVYGGGTAGTAGSSGSGVALGDRAGVATLVTAQSGSKVAGMLLNDVVNYDTTKYHGNFHKDETLINERCNLLRKGRVTTDALVSGQSPAAGDVAYLGASGKLTAAYVNDVATPKVGRFVAPKDENAFVTVDVNLPQ